MTTNTLSQCCDAPTPLDLIVTIDLTARCPVGTATVAITEAITAIDTAHPNTLTNWTISPNTTGTHNDALTLTLHMTTPGFGPADTIAEELTINLANIATAGATTIHPA